MSLSEEERRHLAQALKNLHTRLGSWSCVAEVTGIPQDTLMAAANRRPGAGSGTLAIRVARAAGSTVEVILSGRIGPANSCPTCGSTAAERRSA